MKDRGLVDSTALGSMLEVGRSGACVSRPCLEMELFSKAEPTPLSVLPSAWVLQKRQWSFIMSWGSRLVRGL